MERISHFDYPGELGAAEQVGRAIRALLAESGLELPDFLRAQMEESVLHAIGEDTGAKTVQVGLHFSEAAAGEGEPSSRWGFFLVQKRDGAQLCLEVHLYQE